MTLLTEDRIERICEALRNGATKRSAAQSAGIDVHNLHEWLKRGRRDFALGRYGSEYVELLQAVDKAEADAELIAVSTIKAVGRGGIVEVPVLDKLRRPVRDELGNVQTELVYEKPRWEALAWLLERRYPADWSRQSTVHVGNAQSTEEMTDDEVVTLFGRAVDILQDAKSTAAQRQEAKLASPSRVIALPSTGHNAK